MANAGRLSNAGELFAFEFDDDNHGSFSVSKESTVFSNEFDENTSTDIGLDQRMSNTSGGNLIVLDSINEVDTFDDIPTSNLELHLDDEFLTEGTPQGQQVFTSSGTFTVPTGVTQVSAVVVGGGGGGAGSDGDRNEGNTGGGGGGLAYGTFTVSPGESLTVTVGAAGAAGPSGDDGGAGGTTTIARGATTLLSGGGGQGGQERETAARAGGASGGTERDGGGTGGSSGSATNDNSGSGGGGAAGYSGNGGAGGSNGGSGSAGSGGGGAGGNSATTGTADGGGGVGLLGEGSNGAASGGGGSGGANNSGFNAGNYGGGGGARDDDSAGGGGAGGAGAARIIWGTGRSYPSTLTADQTPSSQTNFWKDLSGNDRHSRITDTWEPYNSTNPSASTTNPFISYNLINFTNTIEVGQTAVIPEIQALSGITTNTYELYNLPGNGSVNSGGNVLYNSVTQSPVVGPIGVTIGTREFFRFESGGSADGVKNVTLRIPPQQVPYTAVKTTHENDGTTLFPIVPRPSSSIENNRGSVLNVPFESSASRLCVCDGTGSASAYTGVTGTAARTVILGVKVPASPSTSYTIFSYGANSAGQRFNIRLQSTGVIQIAFGSSFANIPVSAIDDRNDFLVIAVTVPASGTVSDVRVWLNGNEVTSQLIVNNGSTSINTSSANNVTIGGSSHGTVEYLDDSVITKVMIYSTVLSDLEIKQIYQSIIPDIYPFVERAS